MVDFVISFHGDYVGWQGDLICELLGALVLTVNATPYFRWGDAGQHVEVWRSGWADASCYEKR